MEREFAYVIKKQNRPFSGEEKPKQATACVPLIKIKSQVFNLMWLQEWLQSGHKAFPCAWRALEAKVTVVIDIS